MKRAVLAACLAFFATLAVSSVCPAQTAAFDDAEAQLKVRQATQAAAAAARKVEGLRKELETERQRVVQTDGERDLNQLTQRTLEQELRTAEAEQRTQEANLKTAQEARAQGLAADEQRRKREDAERQQAVRPPPTTAPPAPPPAAASPIMPPAQAVQRRQENRKQIGAAMRAVKAIIDSRGPTAAAASQAGRMRALEHEFMALFPPGSLGYESKALPQVWSDNAGFRAASRTALAAYDRLAAASGNPSTLAQAFSEVGRACGACHLSFRARAF